MKKEDILNRLTCLDKTLLAEIKGIFDREEKLSKIVNGLKTAFDELSEDDPFPVLMQSGTNPSCTDRRMKEMQENREFIEAQRYAHS